MVKKHKRRRKSSGSSDLEDEISRKIRKLSKALEKKAKKRSVSPSEFSEVQPEDKNEDRSTNMPVEENTPLDLTEEEEGPSLDTEILELLGYDALASKNVGSKIHNNIAEI
ncbi:hypothetical protein ABEB36_009353 [Hypothenemus hampei]|uniref:Uncharacterized protein n=1 Tax=Hypothenemus hampei TaxID=57062 RepID=A0ABD1EGF7_HYPHA